MTVGTVGIEMSGLQIHSDLVRQGFENVLKDERFKIGGSKANAAIESAKCVLHWASRPENKECFIACWMNLFSNRTFSLCNLNGLPIALKKKNQINFKCFSPWLACLP